MRPLSARLRPRPPSLAPLAPPDRLSGRARAGKRANDDERDARKDSSHPSTLNPSTAHLATGGSLLSPLPPFKVFSDANEILGETFLFKSQQSSPKSHKLESVVPKEPQAIIQMLDFFSLLLFSLSPLTGPPGPPAAPPLPATRPSRRRPPTASGAAGPTAAAARRCAAARRPDAWGQWACPWRAPD